MRSNEFSVPVTDNPPGPRKGSVLLGVRFDRLSREEALATLSGCFGQGQSLKVYIVNAHTLNLAWENPVYRQVLNEADFLFNDGSGVNLAGRLAGRSFPSNLVGTDLVPQLCEQAAPRSVGVFFLGGRSGIPEKAAERMDRLIPGLRICGTQHGYFREAETERIVEQINNSGAGILLVAFGNPLQEMWIHQNARILKCDVCIGVGGLFDHLAGRLRRAPSWMRRAGIEWVHILLGQPHKWRRYLLGNPLFVKRAVQDRLGWGP